MLSLVYTPIPTSPKPSPIAKTNVGSRKWYHCQKLLATVIAVLSANGSRLI